jgi:hypothetical protein
MRNERYNHTKKSGEIMKRIIAVYGIFCIYMLAGCVTPQFREGYSEQTRPIVAIHDPNRDLKTDNGAKVAVIIPQVLAADSISAQNFEMTIRSSFKAVDQKSLTFVVGSEIERLLTSQDLKSKYNAFTKNGPLAEDNKSIQQFGARLGFKYVVFPVVDECSVSDFPVFTQYDRDYSSSEYSWPAFSLAEMQKTGSASVSMKVYPIKSIENVEDYYGKSSVSEMYDTAETLSEKRRAVNIENQRRRSENAHRDREKQRRDAERERESKNHKQSKAENALDLLDILSDDDERLPMIDLSKVYKKTGATPNQTMIKNMITASCESLVKNYFRRYEGETVSGNTVNGIGEFRFESGMTCIGSWKDGKATGLCKLKDDRIEYKGEFADGYASGAGEYRTAGTFYTGNFSNGLVDGAGVLDVIFMPNVYVDEYGSVRQYTVGKPGNDVLYSPVKNNRKYRVVSHAGAYTQMILLKE